MERTEATGFGVALVGHIALVVALMFLLDKSGALTPPPAMEVSFAEDVGLVSTAPETEASAPAEGEEPGPAEEAAGGEASVPEPVPVPEPEPARTPSPPTPRDRPEEPRRTARSNVPSQPRPQPQQRPQAQPQRQQQQRTAQAQPQRQGQPGRGQAPQSRGSRLPSAGSFGDDAGTSRSQGAVVTAQVSGNIAGALRAAFTPCANRAALPAEEARNIFVTVRVTLNRDGSLANIDNIRVRNSDPDLARYEQRMRELTLGIVRCATPVRQLASQLGDYYDVPRGWRVSDYTFPQRR